MDKKIIKKYLTERFLSEIETPGIDVTDKAKKESKKINQSGVDAIVKDVTGYEKSLKEKDPNMDKMATNKYNYTDDAEKKYHDEMETLNGLEMNRYTSEPGAEFKSRAQKAIEGDSTMGNAIGANAEETWGASSDDFAKKLTQRVRDSEKKRNDAYIATYELGDKIMALPDDHKVQRSTTAIGGKKVAGDTTKAMQSASEKTKTKTVQELKSPLDLLGIPKTGAPKTGAPTPKKPNDGDSSVKSPTSSDVRSPTSTDVRSPTRTSTDVRSPTRTATSTDAYTSGNVTVTGGAGKGATNVTIKEPDGKQKAMDKTKSDSGATYKDISEEELKKGKFTSWCKGNGFEGPSIACAKSAMQDKNDTETHKMATFYMNTVQPKGKTTKDIDENKNNKTEIKESMKRLRFKKPFNGFGNALKLIPEGYRTDKKEFEMTDGNETYRIRWEGTLTEGKAVVITAADKVLVNEDIKRMKELFNYKSQDTLGLVKGNARIDENVVFSNIWDKSKNLFEESEDIEDVKAKEGDLDDAVKVAKEATEHVEGSVSTDKGTQAPAPKEGHWEDKVKGQAAEAKKHIEGTTSTDKGTQAPAPKEGNWEEIKTKATDATKDVESGKPTNMATDKAKVVKENEESEKMNSDISEDEEGEEMNSDSDEEKPDNWEKPEGDDDSSDENEPASSEIKDVVPTETGDEDDTVKVPNKAKMSLLKSPSTGEYWIDVNGKKTLVPEKYLSIASGKGTGAQRADLILKKMEEEVLEPSSEEGLDENTMKMEKSKKVGVTEKMKTEKKKKEEDKMKK